jgi:hypothetical protein
MAAYFWRLIVYQKQKNNTKSLNKSLSYFFCSNNNAIKDRWQKIDMDPIWKHKFPFLVYFEYLMTP